jgi:hypothetical protein
VRSPRVEFAPVGVAHDHRESWRQRAVRGVAVGETGAQRQLGTSRVLADGERAELPQRVDGDISLSRRRTELDVAGQSMRLISRR